MVEATEDAPVRSSPVAPPADGREQRAGAVEVDVDALFDLPSETDCAPTYPECPRCFSLCGERKYKHYGKLVVELWCSFCLTIATPRPKPRGAIWELNGYEVRGWNLKPLTKAALDEANADARRRAAWRQQKIAEEQRARRLSVQRGPG